MAYIPGVESEPSVLCFAYKAKAIVRWGRKAYGSRVRDGRVADAGCRHISNLLTYSLEGVIVTKPIAIASG